MRQVPQFFIDEFNRDSRRVRTTVYLYYEPNNIAAEKILWANDIADWDIVQELQDTGVPCAYLGSNSAIVKIYNENKKYSEDETERKYIKRGTKLRIGMQASSNGIFDGPNAGTIYGVILFTGWIDNYEFSDDGNYVTVTAYDSLHYLQKQPSPWFRTSSSTPIPLFNFIDMYLRLCKCREIHGIPQQVPYWYVGYEIDQNINVNIRPLLSSNGTIGDVLRQIAQYGICAIFCDCNDVIQVQLIPRRRIQVYEFDDYTQIFSSASRTTGYEDYTHVAVNVYDTCSKAEYSLARASNSYSAKEVIFKKGENEYNDLSLRESIYPTVVRFVSDTRMSQPNDMPLEPAINKAGPPCWMGPMPMVGSYTYITEFSYALDKIAIKIWSAKGYEEDLDLYSYDEGRVVGSTTLYTDETEDSFFLMAKTLEIDTQLMTEKGYADQCAFTYVKLISQGAHKIDASVRGQPALELLDLVGISNPQAVHDDEQMLITRFHYTYDGSLSCDIESLSYSTIMLMIFAFLSPGFYIPYDAGAQYITASCDPPEAGMVEGGGPYAVGESARLVVVPMVGWEVDHWEDAYGNRVEGSTDTFIVTVEGTASYKAVMTVGTSFMTFTMDVNMEHPDVYIPPLAVYETVTGIIDWGDGTSEPYKSTWDYTHTYQIAGTMEITVKAPIHYLAAEIFANSTQINTFTAGSDLNVMYGGTFYNSSVKNVNLLPSNVVWGSGGVSIYNSTVPSANVYTTGNAGINIFNTASNSKKYVVAFYNGGYTDREIPKYYNGALITDITTVTTFTNGQNVVFAETGYANININNSSTLQSVVIPNVAAVDNLYISNVNLPQLNIPATVSSLNINGTNTQILELNTPSTYIVAANNVASSMLDLYLGDRTTRLDLMSASPVLNINVHVPETMVDEIHDYSGSNLNIITYEGDDNNGNAP